MTTRKRDSVSNEDSQEGKEKKHVKRYDIVFPKVFKLIPDSESALDKAKEAFALHYDKLIPFVRTSKGDFHTKDSLNKDRPNKIAYLWCGKSELEVEDDLSSLIPFELCGLHRHGGYYGFFKPSIIEVIWLLLELKDGLKLLEDCKKAYVTTDTYPNNGKFRDCYRSKLDRHQGKTLFYFV